MIPSLVDVEPRHLPPELVEGKEEDIVKEVLNSRLFHQKIQYLVKWEGYGVEHNTWEYLDHLNNALDKVAEFYTRHPGAPQQIHALTFGIIPFHLLSIPPASSQCFSRGGDCKEKPLMKPLKSFQSLRTIFKVFKPSSSRHFICLVMSCDIT